MHKLILLCLFLSTDLFAAKPAAASSYSVNIDNPSFRKLIVAIPRFEREPETDPKLSSLSQLGQEKLNSLFEFSGLFNVMKKEGYEESLKKAFAKGTKKSSMDKDLEGVDIGQWKALGVEALTLTKILRKDSGYRVELRSIDINRSQRILGKAYFIQNEGDLTEVLKRYVDRLLEAYTGKPGIFTTKIVFTGRKSKEADKQVYICDWDGSNVQQITNTANPHLAPNWSPDGKQILYTSYDAGNPDLYLYDLEKGKQTKISGQKGVNSAGSFSPNGKLIVFAGSYDGNSEIYLARPDEPNKKVPFIKSGGIEVDPIFSPDGKHIAFVSGRFGNPHIFRGEVMWSNNGESVKVLSDKRLTYAGWYNANPSWSPDSQKIVFAGYDKEIDRFDVFLMNSDGTQLERLTLKAGDNENPSFSPNGQLIVYNSDRVGNQNQRGISQLYLMNKDGSGQRMIPTGLYEADGPKWGPYLLEP